MHDVVPHPLHWDEEVGDLGAVGRVLGSDVPGVRA
jgi:hypothetical protein